MSVAYETAPADAPGSAADRLREEVALELGKILPKRSGESSVAILGAGSDDIDAGREYLAKLAAGGYAVPTWSAEYGGMGLSQTEAETVRAVLAEFEGADLYPFMVGLDLIGPTILAHGSPEQKARWLPTVRSGAEIWCQMFSEPDAGSDLAGVKTKAVRDGDGWRVTGSKVWTSRAHYSQWGLLLARTDASVPKHKGITAFGVDMTSPGVTVRPLVQMNGDSHFNEVFLDGAVVPDANRVGAVGDGWAVALTCLSFERGALGNGLGVSESQMLRLAERIDHDDLVARQRWASLYTELRINQIMELRAAEARRSGQPPGPGDSGMKLRATALIKRLSSFALEVAGPAAIAGSGIADEWQNMFLMSPSLSIRGGTDEIQRNILGERVLGLPREPRTDKDQAFSPNAKPGEA